MPMSRRLVPAIALLSSLACDPFGDGTNDYDCESTWSREGEVLSRKDYEYLKVPSEQEATRRCKEDMLKDIPKGGKLAECKCVGRKAERVK
jgi:hypothetical protein